MDARLVPEVELPALPLAVVAVAHSPAALDSKVAQAQPVKLLLLTRWTNIGGLTARQGETGIELFGMLALLMQRAGQAGLLEIMHSSLPTLH